MKPKISHILTDIDTSTSAFEEMTYFFTEKEFNYKISKDMWSAGEVVEHVTLLESLILKVMQGDVKSPDRPIDEKIVLIGSIFGNFERKLYAPDPIQPLAGIKDREELIETFKAQREELKEFAKTLDLSEICLSFVHRAFGEFTRLEWIYFDIFHSERHLQQLRNLKASLNAN